MALADQYVVQRRVSYGSMDPKRKKVYQPRLKIQPDRLHMAQDT